MRNKILLTLASVLMAGSMLAQDFEYQGINYTVLDASAKTVTTKAGSNASTPGNTITGKVSIPAKVVYNNNEYTVTEIGQYSFNYPGVTAVEFSSELTAIRTSAFRESGLTEVNVPNNVTTIEQQAFSYCPDLKTVTIGKGVNYITYLFFSCRALETVVFKGEQITEVGTGTFAYCTSLKSITIYSPTPPKTNSAAFAFMSPSNVTLYVPEGSENAYKNATTWNGLNIVGVELPDDEPTEPEQPSAGNVFSLVTNLDQIGDQAEIIILDSQDEFALGNDYRGDLYKNNRSAVTDFVKNSDGTVIPGEEVCIATITKKDNGYVIFAPIASDPTKGYLSMASPYYVNTSASEDQAAVLTININETTGVAAVTDGSYYLGVNLLAGNYFKCTGSSNEGNNFRIVKLYVRGGEAPEEPEEPEEPIEPEQPAGNDFTLVTSLDQIGDQAEIIILDSQDAFAMGKEYRSSSDRNSVTDFVKNSDGTVTPGETVSVATITKKDNGYVIFAPMASDPTKGYLQLNGSILDTWISEDLATVLTITIDEKTGVAIVKNENNRYLTANPYTNPPYFRTNTSSNESITSRNLKFYMRAASTEEPEQPEEPIEPEEPAGNDFTLVTNIDQIGDQAEIIILDSQDEFAMGKEYFRSSAKYHRNAVTDFVKNSDGTVTPGEQVSIATITKKDNGYIIFAPMASNPALGYLNLNTVLDTYEREDEATVLTITIDEKTGVAIVKSEDNRYLGVDPRNDQFRSNVTSVEGDAHRNVKLYVRGSSAVEPEQPEEPEELMVPSSIFMNIGESHNLSVYLTDNAEVRTLAATAASWTSSAPEVTSVTADGTATGAGYGTAVITANGATGNALLSVNTYVGTTLTVVYPDGSKVEHHVPYNTVANITIAPSQRWNITSASHDGADVTDAVKAGKYVSAAPLKNNSTITLVANEYNDPTTGVDSTTSATEIRILVYGRTITVVGADEMDTVAVYDLQGRKVYEGLNKVVTVADAGVYVVRVADKAYKLAIL